MVTTKIYTTSHFLRGEVLREISKQLVFYVQKTIAGNLEKQVNKLLDQISSQNPLFFFPSRLRDPLVE